MLYAAYCTVRVLPFVSNRPRSMYRLVGLAVALGVSVADINHTLATAWGGTYVNDFIDRGRIKKVYLQADADARMKPEDLAKWYVRNKQGEMVPFSAFAELRWVYGSPRLERFNGLPSAEILGQRLPELSQRVREVAQEASRRMGFVPPRQALVLAVVGIGISGDVQTVSKRMLMKIVLGWILAPVSAGLLAYLFIRFVPLEILSTLF